MQTDKPTTNTDSTNDTGAQVGIKRDFSGLMASLKTFFSELIDIKDNTDQENTIASIKADISFKGHTAWILVCSIFIASIGLNANSTAVVIGAMLISPLMGPILGMGLSIAINDIDTLRRSVKNFLVMVGLSVLTAFLFFKFFPLRDESSELLARTAPDIRDVLIAFFGGLALVIARTKKGTIASVIYGVAIATALMPPLCTVGFGLSLAFNDAKGLEYAWGAMYLFIINTMFIGLATFLVLKFLQFPMVRYANSSRRKFISRLASIGAIVVMAPAIFTFYDVFQESIFKKQANEFIKEHIALYQFSQGGLFLDNLTEIKYKKDGGSFIKLVVMGDELISENTINTWKAQKDNFSTLKQTSLQIVQGGKDTSEQKFKYVSELYESKKNEVATKEQRIAVLEQEVQRLRKLDHLNVPFEMLSKEIKINYDAVTEVKYANVLQTNFTKIDTVPTFLIKWKQELTSQDKNQKQDQLKQWLQLKLQSKKVEVVSSTP